MFYQSFKLWLENRVINDAVLPKEPFSFPYTQPVNDVDHAIEQARERYNDFAQTLFDANTGGALNQGTVYVDSKKKESILNKLQRGKSLQEITDFLRGAIVTRDEEMSKSVVEWFQRKAKIIKYEYKAEAKPEDKLGYRGAYHIDIDIDGMVCEVQIMNLSLWNTKKALHKVYSIIRGTDQKISPQMAKVMQGAVRKALAPKPEVRVKIPKFRYDPTED